jgi:hypothetical protein
MRVLAMVVLVPLVGLPMISAEVGLGRRDVARRGLGAE